MAYEAQQADNKRRLARFMEIWLPRKEALEKMYLQDGLSQEQIAKGYGVYLATLQKAMRRLGIQSKSKGRRGKESGQYKHGKESRLYRTLIVKAWCELCMKADHLCIHHRNNDHYDNRPENLAVYCQRCHQSAHKKAWWRAKKAGLTLPRSNAPVGWNK